jgi:hypothetical protein
MSVNLNGTLDLAGTLVLRDMVLVGGVEALVVLPAPGTPSHGMAAAPVLIPPPPSPPQDPGLGVWIIESANRSVLAGSRALVTTGQCVQGNIPTWPGNVLPSKGNQGVRAAGAAVCLVGDGGVITAGGPVTFTTSGQG